MKFILIYRFLKIISIGYFKSSAKNQSRVNSDYYLLSLAILWNLHEILNYKFLLYEYILKNSHLHEF